MSCRSRVAKLIRTPLATPTVVWRNRALSKPSTFAAPEILVLFLRTIAIRGLLRIWNSCLLAGGGREAVQVNEGDFFSERKSRSQQIRNPKSHRRCEESVDKGVYKLKAPETLTKPSIVHRTGVNQKGEKRNAVLTSYPASIHKNALGTNSMDDANDDGVKSCCLVSSVGLPVP
jgi:hypothetical protein